MKVSNMELPPLFKYLDVSGAKLTLKNQTLKHAKPSSFNDDMDMVLENVFPEDIETACQLIMDNFTDVLMGNLDSPVTSYDAKQRLLIARLQQAYKQNPDAASIVEEARSNDKVTDIYDLDHMKGVVASFVEEMNEFLQGYRVLCVSESKSTVRMWERYAENHKGVVLRVTPNLAKDSKFKLFRKVDYVHERPTLYDNARVFLEASMFGNKDDQHRELLNKIIYSKTFEWEYEREYRLTVPVPEGDNSWDFPRYHSEEISELYFGANMDFDDQREIMGLAYRMNPEVDFYQTSFGADDRICFQQYS